MKRAAVLAAVVAVGGLVGLAATVRADHLTSELRLLANHSNARFNPRVQALAVEERLRRPAPAQLEISSPYLPQRIEDRGIDQQIRRLGDLIRRQEATGQ